MNIGCHTFEEFRELAREFHGFPAPGLMLGAYMVEHAKSLMPGEVLYDALVETEKCLPDAVQLLTPLSTGNGWMKVLRLGRFALSLYDKQTGMGRRVFLDPEKLAHWPLIQSWLLKKEPKRNQDTEAILQAIREAGNSVCSSLVIRMQGRYLTKPESGRIEQCPMCGEYYPGSHGPICRGCQGDEPYTSSVRQPGRTEEQPSPGAVSLEESVGRKALHDMTRIVAGESKQPEIVAGQTIGAGDLCRLQLMGRTRIFVEEERAVGADWLHENEAALALAERMAGPGVSFSPSPREGKVNFFAERDGLLEVDSRLLTEFNLLPEIMCASRQGNIFVQRDKPFAGARAIPLHISREAFQRALSMADQGPFFRVLPLRPLKVGILITGSEVFQELVQDRFTPVIRGKVEHFGCHVTATEIQPDDPEAIAASVKRMTESGAELMVTTAGLSVDPDDVTRTGLIRAGVEDLLYGAPVLPGAMTLLGRIGSVRLIGVPACALYYGTTSFDLLLPRLLAGQQIGARDLAEIAEGGFCLACSVCTFPKCPFGK